MEIIFGVCAALLLFSGFFCWVFGLTAVCIVYFKVAPDEFAALYKYVHELAFWENGFVSMAWVAILSLALSGYVYFAEVSDNASARVCFWGLVVFFAFLTFMSLAEWLLRDRLTATSSLWNKPRKHWGR